MSLLEARRRLLFAVTGILFGAFLVKLLFIVPGSPLTSVSQGGQWGGTGSIHVSSSSSSGQHLHRDPRNSPSPSGSLRMFEYNVSMLDGGALLSPHACNETLASILATQAARGSGVAARRALYAVAAGTAAAALVHATVSHFLSYPEFDVVILAYDNYNWSDASKHPWAALGEPRVRIIRTVEGFKYVTAKQHLPADLLRSKGYSHLFLWDDDIELQPSFDARDVLLTLQLAPQIKVAAPFVTDGCHLGCWVLEAMGAAIAAPTAAKPATWAHLLVHTPEMMVPIYEVEAWACYADLVDPELPESWGIDSPTAGCLCRDVGATLQGPGQAMLMHDTVAHRNLMSLSRADIERARQYERKVIAALRDMPGGVECEAVGGPLRGDGELAQLAHGACLVPISPP